jgi:hypothetical protein
VALSAIPPLFSRPSSWLGRGHRLSSIKLGEALAGPEKAVLETQKKNFSTAGSARSNTPPARHNGKRVQLTFRCAGDDNWIMDGNVGRLLLFFEDNPNKNRRFFMTLWSSLSMETFT